MPTAAILVLPITLLIIGVVLGLVIVVVRADMKDLPTIVGECACLFRRLADQTPLVPRARSDHDELGKVESASEDFGGVW